jgi:hypothetical protein
MVRVITKRFLRNTNALAYLVFLRARLRLTPAEILTTLVNPDGASFYLRIQVSLLASRSASLSPNSLNIRCVF